MPSDERHDEYGRKSPDRNAAEAEDRGGAGREERAGDAGGRRIGLKVNVDLGSAAVPAVKGVVEIERRVGTEHMDAVFVARGDLRIIRN